MAAEELKKRKKGKKMEVKNHSSNTIRHESSNIPCGNEGQAICEQHDFVIG